MPTRKTGRPLKPRDRQLRASRSGGRFSPKPHPLSLAVRAALRRHARLTSALTLGAMLSAGISTNALAADVTVTTPLDVLDGDTSSITALISDPGPDTLISLREAVIAANNTAGADTIILDAQTYSLSLAGGGENAAATGDLDITSDITIQGTRLSPDIGGQVQSVINATGLGERVLHVLFGASLTLEQTTVTGGTATGTFPSGYGGGILNTGTTTLDQSIVSDNSASYGAGIANDGDNATLILSNSTISGNSASSRGGGIFIRGTATLTQSTVEYNSALYGGGLFNFRSATLNESTVKYNSASNDGGGIHNAFSATLTYSTVAGNSAAQNGGGIFNAANATARFESATVVSDNSANGSGGGIYNGFIAMLTESTVSGNSANFGGGGIENRGTATLNQSIVSGNTAASGAGIANSRTATLENSTVSGNSAYRGGGLFNSTVATAILTDCDVLDNSARRAGGGIENFGTATLNRSTISGNSADYGGGIGNRGTAILAASTVSGNSAASDGGGVENRNTATLTHTTISGNSAVVNGGGIHNISGIGYAAMTVTHATVSGNTAHYGGGIHNYGAATVMNSTVSGNNAHAGGGIHNNGGIAILSNSTFEYNTASYHGGGIFNSSNATAMVESSTVSGNSASVNGGGIASYDTVTLKNSTVSGNSAALDGGGIFNDGSATLTHSTISGNSADFNGGGIYNRVGGTTMLTNSLVANSTGSNCFGSIIDGDVNLADDASCGPNLYSSTINLGTLAFNGGSTRTHALLVGSSAIDAITGCVNSLATDQRGVSRPQGASCDIGAYEDNDADDDGIEDSFEIRFGLNPNVNDASEDPDGDGKTNLEEFLNQTHPLINEPAVIQIINSILLDD